MSSKILDSLKDTKPVFYYDNFKPYYGEIQYKYPSGTEHIGSSPHLLQPYGVINGKLVPLHSYSEKQASYGNDQASISQAGSTTYRKEKKRLKALPPRKDKVDLKQLDNYNAISSSVFKVTAPAYRPIYKEQAENNPALFHGLINFAKSDPATLIAGVSNPVGAAMLGTNNLISDNGIAKTIRMWNKGDYGAFSRSLLGDILDVAAVTPAAYLGVTKGLTYAPRSLKSGLVGYKLNNAVRTFDGTVGEEYFRSPDNWYRITSSPEIYGIREQGMNVTTTDLANMPNQANSFRTFVMDHGLVPGTGENEGYWMLPQKIRDAARNRRIAEETGELVKIFDIDADPSLFRKTGSAHGNRTQASWQAPWNGSTATTTEFPEYILEGSPLSNLMMPYGKKRSFFLYINMEDVPSGGRVGFKTGEMPMDNLRAFRRLPNGRYKYEGIILPDKRIDYTPVVSTKKVAPEVAVSNESNYVPNVSKWKISPKESHDVPTKTNNSPIRNFLNRLKSNWLGYRISSEINNRDFIPEYKTYVTNPRLYENGSFDDYKDYLTTIFPESQYPLIAYHGGPKGITKFRTPDFGKNKNINTGTKDYGIYFTNDPRLAEYYASSHKKNGQIYNVKLNLPSVARYDNPIFTLMFIGGDRLRFSPDAISKYWYDRLNLQNYNGIILNKSGSAYSRGQITMFDPNDIHILGSPDDINSFLKWKQNPKTYPVKSYSPDDILNIPVQYNVTFGNILRLIYGLTPIILGGGVPIGGISYLLSRDKENDSLKQEEINEKD